MSLLVDVREVPWRLFWTVRARILANREAQRRRLEAQQLRGHTRPRPQQRVFGATMSTYRRPEPAPPVLDTPIVVGLGYFTGIERIKVLGGQYTNEWRCKIISGDGSQSVELVHQGSAQPPDADGLGAPGFQWAAPEGGYLPLPGNSTVVNELFYRYRYQKYYYSYELDTGSVYQNIAEKWWESRLRWDSRGRFYVLPAGDGSCIVITYYSTAWSVISTGQTQEDYLTKDNRNTNASGDPVYTARRSYLQQLTNSASSNTHTIKCAIVGWDGVREIATPSGLESKIHELAGIKMNTSPVKGRRFQDYAYLPDYANIPGINAGAVIDYDYTIHSAPRPDVGSYEPLTDDIAKSHGITQIVDEAISRETGMYTAEEFVTSASPSIYYYLQIATVNDNYSTEEGWTPAYWAGRIGEQVPFNVPVVAPTNTLDPPFTFSSYAGPLPTSKFGTIAADAEGLKTLKLKRMEPTTPIERPDPEALKNESTATTYDREFSKFAVLKVTDWNQPAYCRQQLAALGFRPEDMRP